MLTRSTLALAILSSKPFLVCSPQFKEAETTASSTTTETTTATTETTATDPTDTTATETTDTDTSSTTGPAMCGNGMVEAGEDCDDGNDDNEDDCLNNCKVAACGDDFVNMGVEECDDGDVVDTNACTAECKTAFCGDGITWEGMEECDDGNDVDDDACMNNCKMPLCGDGMIQGSELCDNGGDNVAPETAGPTDCTTACRYACGDGITGSGEECDDGGTVSADGCTATCFHEYLMFATKDVYPADFGGVAGGDAICQAAADGKFPGTWVAWLSAGLDNASGDLPTGKPVVRTDGAPIVAVAEDLIKGPETVLMNPIDRDEDGNEVAGYAWTGTSFLGQPSGGDCTGWTLANATAADIGTVTSTTSTWTRDPGPEPFTQLQCSATNHLYCFRRKLP